MSTVGLTSTPSIEDFEKFLTNKIKVDGKTGNLGDKAPVDFVRNAYGPVLGGSTRLGFRV